MSNGIQTARFALVFLLPACLVIALAMGGTGCGAAQETTDEQWESTPGATPAAEASVETKMDSMKTEARRLKEQLDAMAVENRNLTARNAELETKLAEASAAPVKAATTVAPPVNAGNNSSAYAAALDQFKKKNFAEAAAQFGAILSAGAGNNLEDNCHYWIGESMYGQKKYDDAIKEFETVLGFKGSGKRPYAQLMIGNAYAMKGNKESARDAYNKVVSNYPASDVVEKAKTKLAKFK
jgi:tol-pal system protein YbgF